MNDTLVFYRRLGFDGTVSAFPFSYAILRRGAVVLHFFTHEELNPAESNAGCYIRVSDIESVHASFAAAKLPQKEIPRQDPLTEKPWGLREFAIIDPDGNLLRIGQPAA